MSGGVDRALGEALVPNISLLVAVAIVSSLWGPHVAGGTYVLGMIIQFGSLYFSSKYWSLNYTLRFVVTGFVVILFVPGVISQLVPDRYGLVGIVFTGLFVAGIGKRTFDKQ